MSEGDQFGAEPAKPKQKMGGGTKLLMGCGIGAGLLMVICCGGVTIVYFWAQRSISKDPVVVRQVAEAIAPLDVPETMKPVVSMDIKIPYQEGQTRIAVFEIDGQKGVLTLAQFPPVMTGEEREEMLARIKQQGRQQKGVVGDRSEELDLTIRDKPAKFLLVHGKAEDSDVEAWQVSGVFEGKDGPALLMLMVDADAMSKDEVVGLLKSLE